MNAQKGAFRLYAKVFYLTHPNMPNGVTLWQYLSALEERMVVKRQTCDKMPMGCTKIDGFCIGRQRHKSGKSHFHAFIRAKTRCDVRCSKYFDVSIGGITYHGNYQTVKNISAVLNYCRKDGEYIEHNLVTGMAKIIINCPDELNVMMALDRSNKRREYRFWTQVYRLYKSRRQHKRRKSLRRHIVSFDWFSKFNQPQSVMGWVKGEDQRPKGLLLTGPAETGKTSFIIKMAQNAEYFIATEPKHFKNYKGEELIGLDEFQWARWATHIPFLKNIITGHRVFTPSYYGSKELATPRRVVICTNEDPREWPMPDPLKYRFYLYRTDLHTCHRWDGIQWQTIEIAGIRAVSKSNLGGETT